MLFSAAALEQDLLLLFPLLVVPVVCLCSSPTAPLTHANLFLAKHVLETFQMKPIAEEEEKEDKVEVVKVPVAKPKSPEPLRTWSGTAAVAFSSTVLPVL